jgi:hypothetical protein
LAVASFLHDLQECENEFFGYYPTHSPPLTPNISRISVPLDTNHSDEELDLEVCRILQRQSQTSKKRKRSRPSVTIEQLDEDLENYSSTPVDRSCTDPKAEQTGSDIELEEGEITS